MGGVVIKSGHGTLKIFSVHCAHSILEPPFRNPGSTSTTYPPTHPSLTTDRHVSDRQSACLPAKQSHSAKPHPNPAKDISSYTVNPLGLEETPNSSKPQNAAPHPWSCTSRQHGIFKPESCGLLNGSRIKKYIPLLVAWWKVSEFLFGVSAHRVDRPKDPQ